MYIWHFYPFTFIYNCCYIYNNTHALYIICHIVISVVFTLIDSSKVNYIFSFYSPFKISVYFTLIAAQLAAMLTMILVYWHSSLTIFLVL